MLKSLSVAETGGRERRSGESRGRGVRRVVSVVGRKSVSVRGGGWRLLPAQVLREEKIHKQKTENLDWNTVYQNRSSHSDQRREGCFSGDVSHQAIPSPP